MLAAYGYPMISVIDLFEKYQGYRRIIFLFSCALIWYTTVKSFELAFENPKAETAALIATIQIPVSGMFMFVSKLYWAGRKNG